MVYVHITVIPDNNFNSDNVIFNFYEDNEVIPYIDNIFELIDDSNNGILIEYDILSRTSKLSIVASNYNFNDTDLYYSFEDLWEEYDKY